MNSRFGSASCVGQLHRTNAKGSLGSSSKDGSVEVGVHDFDKTLEYLMMITVELFFGNRGSRSIPDYSNLHVKISLEKLLNPELTRGVSVAQILDKLLRSGKSA